MADNSNPNAAPAQAPQAPAGPGQAQPASPTPPPALSTESLIAATKAALAGAPPTAAPPGQEPSPGAPPASTPPAPPAPAAPNPANAPAAGDTPPEGGGEPPPLLAAIQMARSKARAQRRETEEQLVAEREQTKSTITELRGEIAELRSLLKAGQPPSPAPPPPDGELAPAGQPDPEIDTLNKQVANSEGWINWCRNNPEGGDVPLENGAIRHLTAEETATQLERHAALLPELRAELRAEMRVNKRLAEVEQRDAALRAEVARRQSEVKAVTWVPELRDPASPATRMASVILQAHPELETNPKGPEILAVLVKGALALNLPLPGAPPVPVNGNPPAAPAAAPPFPAQSRLPGASPALPSGGSSAPGSSSLLARFAASGKPEDKLAWAKAALAGV